MDIWQTTNITADRLYQASLGPLTLYLMRVGDELHIASSREPEADRPDAVSPLAIAETELDASLEWNRYVLGREMTTIRLKPVLPDRSYVARPESVVALSPGRDAVFYISAPISIGIEEQGRKPVTLTEIQTVPLSNIWFGDPTDGELCYSLTTRARRSVEESERRPHRALCTLRVGNDSEETLEVKRLRVHAPYLGLYDDGQRLWTNRITARFQSAEKGSEVEVETRAPGKNMTRVWEPREAIRGSVFTRVFGKFRSEEVFRA